VQWGFSLGQRHPEPKRNASWLQERFLTKGPPDATQSLCAEHWIFKAWGNLVRWDKDRRHTVRPASCRCRPIALSFHRLFLGGLLPSRARFRFAGYATWNQEPSFSSSSCFRLLCLQKNSPPPLDTAHIIGVGSGDWFRHPLPPNRTCGSPGIRLSSRWSYLRED
jgi:hypothetical protein